MTYSLKIWENPRNQEDVRIYIHGTTRHSIYLKKADDGRLVWSSKAHDTPPKYRTGDHYGKVRKDGDAAHEVAEAFDLELGKIGEFERALEIANLGIEMVS